MDTTTSKTYRIGVIGTGSISAQYLGMAKTFPQVSIDACADLNMDSAKAKAKEFGVPRVLEVDELIADPDIDIVLNLTIPKAHVPVSMQALEAGKHTYLEKPLGIDRDEARKLIDFAEAKKLRVGCAPDTFLGAGLQTARKLIDDGAIGQPITAIALNLGRGHEHWHPSPEFYYQPGGGPMLDMGPYYLTAMMFLLGKVDQVAGMVSKTREQREILSEAKRGKIMPVDTEDHVAGTLRFENGVVCTLVTSFATRGAEWNYARPIHIFGTEGMLKVGDPNQFDVQVELGKFGDEDSFETVDYTHPTGFGRSIGLADMACAIDQNRPHRCSGELAMAALDVMLGMYDSSKTGEVYCPKTRAERPAPFDPANPLGSG